MLRLQPVQGVRVAAAQAAGLLCVHEGEAACLHGTVLCHRVRRNGVHGVDGCSGREEGAKDLCEHKHMCLDGV